MKFKTKSGEKITGKEFLKRWKRGMEGITALQQTKTSLWSMIPIFAGVIWGIAITWIGGVRWLTLILSGSFIISTVSLLGMLQKYWRLQEIDKAQKEMMSYVD
jgi:hypothetical protein